MNTFKDIHLYYGLMAQATQKTLGPDKVYNGCIGPEALLRIKEHPETIMIKPYLIPLEAAGNDDSLMTLFKKKANSVDLNDIHQVLSVILDFSNILRQRGYDCDNLIEQEFAICHASYDAKSLL